MKIPEPIKLPSGSWFVRMRLGGVSVPVTAPTAKEAKRQAALIKAEYLAGKRVVKKADERTMDQILKSYINERRQVLSPSTVRGYESVRKTRFKNYMKLPVGSVKNWQQVIDDEVAAGISAKTITNSWRLCVSAFNAAGVHVPQVTLPQIVEKERPWLDAQQIPVFLRAVKGTDCELVALLGLHSLRRSEIFALTWDKVDLKAGDMGQISVEGSMVRHEGKGFVYKETNKTRNSRRVVPIMIPRLNEILAAVPEKEKTGAVIVASSNKWWDRINAVCEENGLPKIGVHGLRHSFASLAHHLSLPEEDAMLIGGWEDPGTMHRIYTHIAAAERLKAENKMAAFYKNANENANESAKAK